MRAIDPLYFPRSFDDQASRTEGPEDQPPKDPSVGDPSEASQGEGRFAPPGNT
ncbi:hypothetical protein PCANC_02824 [Puccinia coronata f. sp. avenae]|uniref:Uncharacterized protein n=1 Tax=Puccinia coronata f. sp. avenae TaxID=200324 RepID=A0A2N5W442_9BASI|nr:hypothetical protein PCASD_16221 [Puccinia coronata f. sp. avenae]PLW42279.1 hypothetical protein PCASD_07747 [Puccinia coronata f. sp. avenae]PLW57016.1 hypothetical protein PCANC_02824 [Puccinia coronata f. sp. avenae]